MRCYAEIVIQIFKTYTVARLRCYICIISHILTDSYRMYKGEYGLHAFIESLCNDILESYSKNIRENYVPYSPVFCPNTGEFSAKNPYSRWFYVVPFRILTMFLLKLFHLMKKVPYISRKDKF